VSDDMEPSGDRADDNQVMVDGYLLLGDEHAVLVRPWKHGEQSAYTILKIFAQTSGFQDMQHLDNDGELFPEFSSESIAEELLSGRLIKADSPVPVPAFSSRRTNKELAQEAERRRKAREQK
jgi:hypothetical protein